ncbi:RNA-guided endonuclease TnpB family protein [Trebonia kvetii]|uniref:RNA-guided endonuclease TnpB family protein n=1 Tax=Trebonia kvetii TaxID=2480626 RepID=UPI0016527A9D|nr:RNA-guided endonuclease TnpB family protein [Trebonia kvetii]
MSFTVEVDRAVPESHARPGTAIGIDLGAAQVRRAARAHARTKPGSAGRRKAAARLARLHARVANLRADALHKATSMLAGRYETIVAEDLNVAGMTRNRRLARAISDQGFGTARRILGYKTAWHDGTLVTADRWYPSTKKCSACGTVKAKLGLSERTYRCGGCGLVLDRDVNAARNLLHLAASGAERRNAGGGTVRPRPARHDPPNPEPGTPLGGKTGTAARQPAAAA